MAEHRVPETIGPYRPLELIGMGGMGRVYRAVGPDGAEVAVKALHPHLIQDPEVRRRLRREVETAGRVHSPRVAAVLDSDVETLQPYIVTRHVPGPALDAAAPLAGDLLWRVAAGTAEALLAIHAAGVVHRDVKPGNVVLEDGEPVVIDFGIAHGLTDTRLTRLGGRSGTPAYQAPELLSGRDAGPAADVFAWAATVAFAATGRHLYDAPNEFAIMHRILHGEHALAEVPEYLRDLLAEALRADPAARPRPAALIGRLGALRPAAAPAPAPAGGPLVPVGPYRPLERIGRGGMGEVFLARAADGRIVAVKTLHPLLSAEPEAHARLRREVGAMRRVAGPRVAELVDADLEADRPYLVTRYVEGRPLSRAVAADGPLAGDALRDLAAGLAAALADVHAGGAVHRDVSPGNVMLVDGGPVLIDFGIAWVVGATRLTRGPVGTPGYLSPEMLRGEEVGPPADVFGWALTVVFAATGRRAYEAPSVSAGIHRILHGEPDLDGVDEDLLPLLREALSLDPARRPAAADLAARLTGRAEPPPVPEPAPAERPPAPDVLSCARELAAEADGARETVESLLWDVALSLKGTAGGASDARLEPMLRAAQRARRASARAEELLAGYRSAETEEVREAIGRSRDVIQAALDHAVLPWAHGEDREFECELTLEEAFTGATREVSAARSLCRSCAGLGWRNGQGTCATCEGEGRIEARRKVTVRFPPAVADGDTVQVSDGGEPGLRGGSHGALTATVTAVGAHPVFARLGDDLYRSVWWPHDGTQGERVISVEGMNDTLNVRIPACSRAGERILVSGHGMPRADGKRGNLYLRLVGPFPAVGSDGTFDEAMPPPPPLLPVPVPPSFPAVAPDPHAPWPGPFSPEPATYSLPYEDGDFRAPWGMGPVGFPFPDAPDYGFPDDLPSRAFWDEAPEEQELEARLVNVREDLQQAYGLLGGQWEERTRELAERAARNARGVERYCLERLAAGTGSDHLGRDLMTATRYGGQAEALLRGAVPVPPASLGSLEVRVLAGIVEAARAVPSRMGAGCVRGEVEEFLSAFEGWLAGDPKAGLFYVERVERVEFTRRGRGRNYPAREAEALVRDLRERLAEYGLV